MNVSLAAAVRGDFVREPYPGGRVRAAVLGRLLFTAKAVAMHAVAFALLIGLISVAVRPRGVG